MQRDLPHFADLHEFLRFLETAGQLATIDGPVSVVHDTTEIHRRVLEDGGPALIFTKPITSDGTVSDISGADCPSIASGSFCTAGMVIAPCSIKTVSAVAYADSGNLMARAADVHLKERRPLLLMVRESPPPAGHMRAMAQPAEAGAIIAPPVPPFYVKPESPALWIDQIAPRALAYLALDDASLAPAERQTARHTERRDIQ